MQYLSSLEIEQPVISLLGSGNSLLELPETEWAWIRERSFVITVNYGPIHFQSDLNMWSDVHVSQFLDEHYKTHAKDRLFLARVNGLGRNPLEIKQLVDFWFDPRKERLRGNYTVVWALQLLRKHFPDKTILLFGIDMYAESNEKAKWYDQFTMFDFQKRGRRFQIRRKLNACEDQLKKFVGTDEQILNCNPKSNLSLYKKVHYRTILSSPVPSKESP